MKKMNNTDPGFKERVAYKKNVCFSLHDDYPPFFYTAQLILINLNEKWFGKSSIMTMSHKLVLEIFCTVALRIQDYCVGN